MGKKSVSSHVSKAIGDFYGDVVQDLNKYQAPAPKLEDNRKDTPM